MIQCYKQNEKRETNGKLPPRTAKNFQISQTRIVRSEICDPQKQRTEDSSREAEYINIPEMHKRLHKQIDIIHC